MGVNLVHTYSSLYQPDYIGFWDGSCEPCNPGGNMGWGFHLKNTFTKQIIQGSSSIPAREINSNNVAEYIGFLRLLDELYAIPVKSKILLLGDSNLIVQQMNGNWGIKDGMYKPYADRAMEKLKQLRKQHALIKIQWIPRSLNAFADDLSKKDKQEKRKVVAI